VRTTSPIAPLRAGGVARPLLRAVVACCVVAVTVVAPASLPGAAGTDCAEATTLSDGTVRVAIAVDLGTLGGAASAESTCVTVAAGASGADVLRERARLLGRPAPRWAQSGLLCAIDGFPATGCSERVDGAYRYWAYHLGSEGSWSWASIGPAFRKATADRMEGWHFVAGTGGPSDPPPRASADPARVCPVLAPAPAPTAPTSPAESGAGSVTAPGTNGSGGQSGAPVAPDAAGNTPNGSARNPGTVTGGGTFTPETDVGASSGDATPTTDDAPGTAVPGSDAVAEGDDDELASGPAGAGSAGVPAGVLMAVVLVLGIAAGGVVRSRRRSA
jgi:hypothetical protein